jgi:cellulose synthase/poly-beta-1,6-N-acetylglucosamine synthase-like glycosyltransferase
MPFPPVTVVIPAYNAARTIERALSSVWRQNYPELEVVPMTLASASAPVIIPIFV